MSISLKILWSVKCNTHIYCVIKEQGCFSLGVQGRGTDYFKAQVPKTIKLFRAGVNFKM